MCHHCILHCFFVLVPGSGMPQLGPYSKISLARSTKTSSIFIPNFAEVSQNIPFHCSTIFKASSVVTCRSSSRSHLFPSTAKGKLSTSFTLFTRLKNGSTSLKEDRSLIPYTNTNPSENLIYWSLIAESSCSRQTGSISERRTILSSTHICFLKVSWQVC